MVIEKLPDDEAGMEEKTNNKKNKQKKHGVYHSKVTRTQGHAHTGGKKKKKTENQSKTMATSVDVCETVQQVLSENREGAFN